MPPERETQPIFFHIARRLLPGKPDQEDAAQTAFVRSLKRSEPFASRGFHAKRYLCLAVHQSALDMARKEFVNLFACAYRLISLRNLATLCVFSFGEWLLLSGCQKRILKAWPSRVFRISQRLIEQ